MSRCDECRYSVGHDEGCPRSAYTQPDLMVPPSTAHAMVRERDYREGYVTGHAMGAAAERARLVAVVRAIMIEYPGATFATTHRALERVLAAMGAEEGGGQ